MSDFHEMANNLRMRKERSIPFESLAYGIDNGGRRLGINRRQFCYSLFFPERRVGDDRRMVPERRIDPKPGV